MNERQKILYSSIAGFSLYPPFILFAHLALENLIILLIYVCRIFLISLQFDEILHIMQSVTFKIRYLVRIKYDK